MPPILTRGNLVAVFVQFARPHSTVSCVRPREAYRVVSFPTGSLLPYDSRRRSPHRPLSAPSGTPEEILVDALLTIMPVLSHTPNNDLSRLKAKTKQKPQGKHNISQE